MGYVSALVAMLGGALYLVLGFNFIRKGWPIRAGLTMCAASFMPLLWQVVFTDSDAPGFAFMLMVLLPPALLVTVVGLIWWSYKRVTSIKEPHLSQ